MSHCDNVRIFLHHDALLLSSFNVIAANKHARFSTNICLTFRVDCGSIIVSVIVAMETVYILC